MRAFIFVAAKALFVASLATAAPLQRTFVSTGGNDANIASNCSLVAPCRSFDTAISAVSAGGEVVALNSGGYGRFTVTKSVTVVAPPGVYAGISVFPGSNGVDINTAGVHVVLRGLAINGQGGVYGINFENGQSLLVENCTISGMTGPGIYATAAGADNNHPAKVQIVATTVSGSSMGVQLAGGPIAVTVSRSTLTENYGGIDARSMSAGIENSVTVQASTLSNNFFYAGILLSAEAATATITGVISDTTISANLDNGVYASAIAGAQSFVTVSGSTITENFNGVVASGAGTMKTIVGENTIARNRSVGLYLGGIYLSRGDNTVTDNAGGNTTGVPGAIGGI